MGGEHDACARLEEPLEGREGGADAAVVGDAPLRQRNVQIRPDEDASSGQRVVVEQGVEGLDRQFGSARDSAVRGAVRGLSGTTVHSALGWGARNVPALGYALKYST